MTELVFVSYFWIFQILQQVALKVSLLLGVNKVQVEAILLDSAVPRSVWALFCVFFCLGLGFRGIVLQEKVKLYCATGVRLNVFE